MYKLPQKPACIEAIATPMPSCTTPTLTTESSSSQIPASKQHKELATQNAHPGSTRRKVHETFRAPSVHLGYFQHWPALLAEDCTCLAIHACVLTPIHVHTHNHTNTHTIKHIHTNTFTHTLTHAHTHTHKHKRTHKQSITHSLAVLPDRKSVV